MLDAIFKLLVGIVQDWRSVRFRCHRAAFAATREGALFLTVTNLSRNRDIEVTHVWIDAAPAVHALPAARPLPRRLRPDEIWETWIPLAQMPPALWDERLPRRGRLRLSTGRIVRALPDRDVPDVGAVPGGPIGR